MSIRSRLVALALAIVLPGLLGALWGLYVLYQQQRDAASRNLSEIARVMSSVVEREIARRETTLKTLALSPILARGDLPAFYAFAKAAAPSNDRAVILTDLSGQQLLNTRVPLGTELPRSTAFMEMRVNARPEETLVSDLYVAQIAGVPSFAVQVPVQRDGAIAAYLSMGSFAATLQKSLEEPRLPPGWNGSIIDRKGTVVARRLAPEQFVGKTVTADLHAQLRAAREGAFETVRLDGVKTFTAFAPIGETGWTFALSMPKAQVDAQILAALKVTFIVTVVLLVLAVLTATYVGRTISRAMAQLVDLASAVGRGEHIPQRDSGLREIRTVANALQHASERIRASNEIMEKRVEDAVADTRRAQDALLQNQKLEALGKLTGGIAHDFNNLLQTISAAIEVALHLSGVDAVKAAMQAGKRAVERATKLTRQLTTFGRGTISAPAVIDLPSYVDELRDLIDGALRENVKLTFHMTPGLWPVYVDPIQLELALLNAALNARDAMPEGGRLDIRAANETLAADNAFGLPPADYVRVSIADTGTGIAPADLSRVFEPFYTTKEVGKGSGLGLAQIYGFARQSGGTATVESEMGAGTTVSIHLPRSERAALPRVETRPADAESEGPFTVLFVEDDQLVRDVVVPGLRASGFKVVTAQDAVTALAALRTYSVDVVFSDIVMPGQGDGLYLAEEMRQTSPGIPIVLATGYSDALTATSSFRVLLKPYTLEQVKSALREEMRRMHEAEQ